MFIERAEVVFRGCVALLGSGCVVVSGLAIVPIHSLSLLVHVTERKFCLGIILLCPFAIPHNGLLVIAWNAGASHVQRTELVFGVGISLLRSLRNGRKLGRAGIRTDGRFCFVLSS